MSRPVGMVGEENSSRHPLKHRLVGFFLLVSSCAWLSSNKGALIADGTKDAECIVREINAGGLVAEDIALACGGLVVEQVVAFAEAKNVHLSRSDGGAAATRASATMTASSSRDAAANSSHDAR
jgi:hypothetical protein